VDREGSGEPQGGAPVNRAAAETPAATEPAPAAEQGGE
jgi:hypothetical protein